jgi:hypothetical protein
MYSRLEAVLGHDEATMLMEHLPPVGWADVATKRDLDVLGGEMRSEIGLLRAEFRADLAHLEKRMLWAIVTGIVASNVTIAGLAFGAAHLT